MTNKLEFTDLFSFFHFQIRSFCPLDELQGPTKTFFFSFHFTLALQQLERINDTVV